MNRPLLLHACCAPCSIAIIDELKNQYDLTVFFYNPNIFPEAEYLKRKAEIVRVCEEWKVPVVDADYEPVEWDNAIKGLEHEPEMGERCFVCFALRLRKAAEYAAKNGFDIFAASLTSGRNKKAEVINPIGEHLAHEYNIQFLSENWKSGGRQDNAKKMIADRSIYRQNYCGCRFSLPPSAREGK